MKRSYTLPALVISVVLAGCATSPEPEAGPIVIAPVPVQTCTPISKLERVVIPAETETFYAITEIDNPPYEPITRKEEMTRVVKEEEVYYVNKDGEQVTDICEEQLEDKAADASADG